jgi:hypothetical protein
LEAQPLIASAKVSNSACVPFPGFRVRADELRPEVCDTLFMGLLLFTVLLVRFGELSQQLVLTLRCLPCCFPRSVQITPQGHRCEQQEAQENRQRVTL